MVQMPNPGIVGDYRDSCAVCLKGSDTGVAFVGDAEWAIAGLQHLGVEDEATSIVSRLSGAPPGMVPDGEITVLVRVCESCARSVGFPVGVIALGVPAMRQYD
jgi:hypothetical protein